MHRSDDATPKLFLGLIVPVVYLLLLGVAVVVGIAAQHGLGTDRLRPTGFRVGPGGVRHPAHRHARSRLHTGQRRMHVRSVPHHRVEHRRAMHASVSQAPTRVSTQPIRARMPLDHTLLLRVARVVRPADMQDAINSCVGPVEILWGSHPLEIAQHDYCGGGWFATLVDGQEVRVTGGELTGLFRVDGSRRWERDGASADSLDGLGDLVLQTCVPGGVELVGLERIGD